MNNYEFWNELGNIFDAVLAYQKKNIEFNKTFITPWVRLGHVFPQEDSNQKDLQAILHAVELDPENPQIWADLGVTFHKIGKLDDAVDAYRRAIELDPAAAWPKSNLALTLETQGKLQEAVLEYRESLEGFLEDQDKAITWNRLGNTYRKLGDFENAVGAFLRADELEAKHSRYRDPMTESLEQESEEEYPLETPKTVTEPVTQKSTSEQNALAGTKTEELDEEQWSPRKFPYDSEESMYLEEGIGPGIRNSTDSASKSNLVMNMNPEQNLLAESMVYPRMSATNLNEIPSQDSISNSEAMEEKILPGAGFRDSMEPVTLRAGTGSSPEILNNSNTGLSTIFDFVQQGDNSESVSDEQTINRIAYEEYLKDFIEPAETIGGQPTTQSPQSRPVPATPTPEEVKIDFNTQNEQVWNELGNVYFNSGAYDDAILAYRQALELDSKFAWAYSNLALTYVQKERFDEAILLYKRSIELFKNGKDKATTWNRLGNLYRRQQDYDNAILAYQTADELDPDNISLSLRSSFSLLGNLLDQQPAFSS